MSWAGIFVLISAKLKQRILEYYLLKEMEIGQIEMGMAMAIWMILACLTELD